MKIVDLKDMPNASTEVKNGMDSVTKGIILLHKEIVYDSEECIRCEYHPSHLAIYPICKFHGAINKVSPDGIWRCLTCNEGAYEIKE